MVLLVLKCHMALWHKCTNFIYERRVPIFIIYHNVHYVEIVLYLRSQSST